jgi:hypothetical protein
VKKKDRQTDRQDRTGQDADNSYIRYTWAGGKYDTHYDPGVGGKQLAGRDATPREKAEEGSQSDPGLCFFDRCLVIVV